jgi:hypothetical protein
MRKASWVSCVTLLFCLSASAEVRGAKPQYLLAYTDPGSGALLLQYLTMGGLFLAFYFSRARSWVARRLGWSQQPNSNEDTSSQRENSEGDAASPPDRAA